MKRVDRLLHEIKTRRLQVSNLEEEIERHRSQGVALRLDRQGCEAEGKLAGTELALAVETETGDLHVGSQLVRRCQIERLMDFIRSWYIEETG